MDEPCACANSCLFCFVDQLPRGMRKTLYFKDDDARLSFLTGNYITLTNPKNNQSGLNRWPYLLPYGQSSLVSNPNLKTVDIYAKQCWLFGGK